jgi:hypothetical protein
MSGKDILKDFIGNSSKSHKIIAIKLHAQFSLSQMTLLRAFQWFY